MNALNSSLHIITYDLNIWDEKFIMLNEVSNFFTYSSIHKFHLKRKDKHVSIIIFSLSHFNINNEYTKIEPSLFKSNNYHSHSEIKHLN